jgi:hypothetical protein
MSSSDPKTTGGWQRSIRSAIENGSRCWVGIHRWLAPQWLGWPVDRNGNYTSEMTQTAWESWEERANG